MPTCLSAQSSGAQQELTAMEFTSAVSESTAIVALNVLNVAQSHCVRPGSARMRLLREAANRKMVVWDSGVMKSLKTKVGTPH